MNKLKIAIGCDHGGFLLKQKIIEFLDKNGYEYKDFGSFDEEAVDYPVIAKQVSGAVSNKEFERGILVCGTGLGMSIVANKFKGIRAVCLENKFSAKATREHNDSNVLCLGGRILKDDLALELVDIWLTTEFQGGRHQKRIDMIE
ncbi:MAG: ribose 5-phosphate isomerase B [Cyanobacteria bacterium SIG30]|nr:ribose 5-phosphate isomerase B [Cyanobacteria bacterium SIG30]